MKNVFAIMILVTALWSCGEKTNKDAMPIAERLSLIEEIESQKFSETGEFNRTKALALVNNYAMFVEENPSDERSPAFLYEAADLSMGLENSELAISYFDKVITDYPEFKKVPYCMFLKGFIYENQLKDLENASAAYKSFIKEYPDHDMTDAAVFSLQNLGKSPEQLIREFEEQNVNQEES